MWTVAPRGFLPRCPDTIDCNEDGPTPWSGDSSLLSENVDVRRAVADGRLLGRALTLALVPVRVLTLVRRPPLDPLRRPHGLDADRADPVGRAHSASGTVMPISSADLRAASVASA